MRVPYDRASVLSLLYERGRVLRREDQPDAVWLHVEVPRSLAGVVAPYCVDGNEAEGVGRPALAVTSPGLSEGGDI